ncbi:hypothetical protein H9Y04_15395 [Streptomyces sp. TRM66268-LWL]|uniref:Uncharacterized protein n=1 Tax=Streptomyces polyasparticus TaxID=2767826 RepID=A0ABR7SH84_9ACTN|nr:hypothetical protein [Streptomyces polyasparticus]MBC9713952.1 hypothetical protein [Streptomyces polyasparticus]
MIDSDRTSTAAPVRRTWVRPALLVPAALAVAGALVVTLATGSGEQSGDSARGTRIEAQNPRGAVVLLDRIAAAAEANAARRARSWARPRSWSAASWTRRACTPAPASPCF